MAKEKPPRSLQVSQGLSIRVHLPTISSRLGGADQENLKNYRPEGIAIAEALRC